MLGLTKWDSTLEDGVSWLILRRRSYLHTKKSTFLLVLDSICNKPVSGHWGGSQSDEMGCCRLWQMVSIRVAIASALTVASGRGGRGGARGIKSICLYRQQTKSVGVKIVCRRIKSGSHWRDVGTPERRISCSLTTLRADMSRLQLWAPHHDRIQLNEIRDCHFAKDKGALILQ